MKVLKFGGTSVGSPESLQSVKTIVGSQDCRVIVTVSALGGITDRLIDMAERAAVGDFSFETVFEEIRQRHHTVVAQVIASERREATGRQVMALLDELYTVCRALLLLRELTPRSLDLVVSYGERMSSLIVTAMLPRAVCLDSLEFMRTRSVHGRPVLDIAATSPLVREAFEPYGQAQVIVVPGFIARDVDGHISNLGRGGSDYTAAILAAELGASVLEIWTDVDGFMTADPRRVSSARVIDSLSYLQAMELCNYGAKVVYPPTIYPVFNAGIPVVVKNTFNPAAPGTLISGAAACDTHGPIGVSSMTPMCLCRVSGSASGMAQRAINALSRGGVEAMLADGLGRCVIAGRSAAAARELLADEFAVEQASGDVASIYISEPQALVTVVGTPDPQPLVDALKGEGIGVSYAALRPAACLVGLDSHNRALNIAHSLYINIAICQS